MAHTPVIFLFTRDFRLNDNAAFAAAIATGKDVLPVYCIDDELDKGSAFRWWLMQNLHALNSSLQALGGGLHIVKGTLPQTVFKLAQNTGAKAVFASRNYARDYQNAAEKLLKLCASKNIEYADKKGFLLFESHEIRTGNETPYRKFTPFMKNLMAHKIMPPETQPDNINFAALPAGGLPPEQAGLYTGKPDWAGGFKNIWQAGEKAAHVKAEDFAKNHMARYKQTRDFPAIDNATSMLSAHLAIGTISPRQLWYIASGRNGDFDFLRQLVWREFSYHLHASHANFDTKPMVEKFSALSWKDNARQLKRWQKGQTGYPLVDAGMRELWQTGYMHNRVRMVVASFLTKHLLIHWTEGRKWFDNTLIDYDFANNAANWQWVAGCGADAAPYFRIFNPVLQSKKFDKSGDYIRKFVPELASLPNKHIHAPWDAPEDIQDKAGLKLGKTYPTPCVDHKAARERALNAYQDIKN